MGRKIIKSLWNRQNLLDINDNFKELYEDIASEKKIGLKILTINGLRAFGDFERIVQSLSNLVDNAIKFSSQNSIIELSVLNKDNFIEFVVLDHGSGIAKEDLPLIWQRLYRGKESSKKFGLGLGLALVQAIAIAHNGSVSVSSVVNSGSTFYFKIPSK